VDQGRHAALLEGLRSLAERAAAEAGVEFVDLSLRGSSRRRTLRVDIERPGPQGVNLDDCKRVSETLGAAIDAQEDLIDGSYLLEVSSPGVDRPIRSPEDIRRNTGRRIVVTIRESAESRRSIRGLLAGLREGVLILEDEGRNEIEIPLEKIETARQDVEF
jgi:ribosome maturation factor RimP